MYSIYEIKELRSDAEHYGLEAVPGFWTASVNFLQRVCNGAEPERWSELKRKALTHTLARYEAAFAIHDYGYEVQANRNEEDSRLYNNMLKIWAKDFGFWRWLRPKARLERRVVIPAVYATVAFCGGEAYNEVQS